MDVAQGSDFGPPSARRELAIVECKDEPLDLMPSRRDATTFSDGRKSALPEDSDRARIDLRQIAPCELADVADDLPGHGDGSDLDGRINQPCGCELRFESPARILDVAKRTGGGS
jgi:hypothetical protein